MNLNDARINCERHQKKRNATCSSDQLMQKTQETQLIFRSDLNKCKRYRFPPGLSPKPPGLIRNIRNNRNNRNNTHNLLQNDHNNLFKAIQCLEPKYAPNIIELLLNELNNGEIQMLLDNEPLLKHKIAESMKKISFNNGSKQRKIKQLLKKSPNKTKTNLPPGLETYIIGKNKKQKLLNKIQHIEPIFAKQITTILLQQINNENNELLLLLSDETELIHKMNEIILTNTFLKNINKTQRNRLIGQRIFDKIQLIEPGLARKISEILLEFENNELLILLSSKKALIDRINEYKQYKQEQICSIQVFRVIVNTIIPKQIFELLLETKCIKKPDSAQKIFVRTHKSYYHENSTVLYIHFINFDEEEYEFCRDQYFDFRDQQNGKRITWFNRKNRYYQNENYYKRSKKGKRTIFDIMGNELGLIKVYKAKEYEPFEANINYLSRIVNICLRCKINKAAPRKRVCTFCVYDERNDRIKIAEYFNNPQNNVNHKMNDEIQKDLIEKLKIELNLIPLTYKRECNNIDIETGKCTSKGPAKCSFIHNNNERIFGEKLNQIRLNAIKRQYNAYGEFELNDYYAVKLQLKYRKIIGEYYNNYWKYKSFHSSHIHIIQKYLINKQIKLYLIPTIYKNWCYYFKDINPLCSKKTNICTFIHDEKEKIFGDMLWRIKYNALQEREKNNNNNDNKQQQQQQQQEEDVSLIDDDYNDYNDNKDDIKQIDAKDKWWKDVINPYKEANEDQHVADKDLAEKWRIDAANISIKAQEMKYEDIHTLYVEYEDDKSAKIKKMRTYVDFTFKCRYKIHFYSINMQQEIVNNLLECEYMYRHFKTRIHILNKIASFAVIPNKDYKHCVACYFNVCDGIKHTKLRNNVLTLYKNCCDGDFNKKRKHDFDTRECDQLHGIVIDKVLRKQNKSNKSNNPRYKVLINIKKTSIETYLKFLIIGSDSFNKRKKERKFNDILISYPCNTHQFIQIKNKLNLLYKNTIHRKNKITRIIFGAIKPRFMRNKHEFNGQHIGKKQIFELFRGLNKSQIDAIYGALNYNLHTIQGPPATGKTNTCAHIAYLWWMLNKGNKGKNKVKIHGMAPTNQGTLLLAKKCHEMNDTKDQSKPKKKFKVLYFASKTYVNVLKIRLLSQKNNDKMTEIETICVNLAAIHKLRCLSEYENMSERAREQWKCGYIIDELKNADMICTTFGNSTHKRLENIDFTHSIADECNQSSLDTFLGIIGYRNLKYLSMAGDIKQLSPVTMSQNKLCKMSVYENIIKYLTSSTFKPNEYYSRLNKQYRSHPQIYNITNIFYDGTVEDGDNMEYKRAYKQDKKNYCKLFANHNNHIQWHQLTNNQKQLDTSSQRHSKYNVGEALIAVKYLKKFIIDLGYKEEDIAVISDYTAQIHCVYNYLTRCKSINEDKILLCTTNEIEGSSKPIIIYMCCRSNNTGNIGFLNDMTRVNVATSRAEYGQIIIGDIYTLQYNPIYKQIFDYHQKHKAVVYQDDDDMFNLKTIDTEIPLVDISMKYINNNINNGKHTDYYICSGCNLVIFAKLFCGRIISVPPIYTYYCYQCINQYLYKYCNQKILHSKFNQISAMRIINKSDLNCCDSFGIKLEFDLVLSRYLMKNGLTKFSSKTKIGGTYELYLKFVKIVWEICYNNNNLKKENIKYIPQCFRKLGEDYKSLKTLNQDEFCKIVRSDQLRNKAIGIMECKRNHLLKQQMIDSRFFRLVYEIKNCKPNLIAFYRNNRYNLYEYRKFEQTAPTLIVIAYLKACGYSTNLANCLHERVSKLLFDKNINKPSRNSQAIQLNDDEIDGLVQYLKLNELTGLNNVLSPTSILYGMYVIKLMQNAIIDDPWSKYYEMRKNKKAIAKESTFGDDLKSAGFDYYSEKELQGLGYTKTPDYLLKKPWIICLNDIRYEITWIDFKYFYCSSTEWIINKLRDQATKYNKTYGPGAFVFSLGFVKIPNQLKLNSHGLLAALPLSKQIISKFINLQKIKNKRKSM